MLFQHPLNIPLCSSNAALVLSADKCLDLHTLKPLNMAFWLLKDFILLLLLTTSVSDEPKCSKFSFEEQLLEKMVRMEFEVEKFSKILKEKYDEIDMLKIAAKAEFRQLQNDREAWKTEIETLKTETIETIKKQTGKQSFTSSVEFCHLLKRL